MNRMDVNRNMATHSFTWREKDPIRQVINNSWMRRFNRSNVAAPTKTISNMAENKDGTKQG